MRIPLIEYGSARAGASSDQAGSGGAEWTCKAAAKRRKRCTTLDVTEAKTARIQDTASSPIEQRPKRSPMQKAARTSDRNAASIPRDSSLAKPVSITARPSLLLRSRCWRIHELLKLALENETVEHAFNDGLVFFG